MDDEEIVTRQLGRELACDMTPVFRCAGGFPVVIKNASATRDGTPFPTLFWITCPALRADIARLEASGAVAGFERFLRSPKTRAALFASERAYRRERAKKTGSGRAIKQVFIARPDPGAEAALRGVGIAGNRNPLHLKCLHAHAADYLVAGLNPIGKKVMRSTPVPDGCRVCGG